MWTRHSYKNFKRHLDYFKHNDPIFGKLQNMPSIVSHLKIQRLKQQIRQCEQHKGILIHCGDCAQPFEHVDKNILKSKIGFYQHIKQFIEAHHKKPATIIGRIAGQYAKPRSSQFTIHNNKQIHNYKGDNVNGVHHDHREPDTTRLFQGYINSTITHNFINNSMDSLYTSHQGLILPYQAALTSQINNLNYCLSAHMLWIGQRTRQIDGGHVQFFRGVNNPIGVKVSNKISDQQFLGLINKLNPLNQEGKLLVIIRMGHKNIDSKLKHLIDIKIKHKLNFLFVSDPMHGNTYETKQHKIKVRHYDHILSQINIFSNLLNQGHLPFGISLQASHQDVTECIGGSHPLEQHHIEHHQYKTKCDPRLNPSQIKKLIQNIRFI